MMLRGTRVGVFVLPIISVFLLALSGCGSGGDSGGGTPPVATPSVGVFVDSPVQGLGYTCVPSGLTGLTNVSGQYSYMPGDTVTFNLYGRVIGAAVPAGPVVTVLSVFNATSLTDPRVVNLSQLLLTLGGLPAPGNPIQVPATPPANFPATIDYAAAGFDTAFPGLTLVSEPTATTHLQGSFKTLSVTVVNSGVVTSTPAGINCTAGTCSFVFTTGTVVSLSETGTGFTGWGSGTGSASCTGIGACAVTLNVDSTVTATFQVAPPPATLTISPAGSGTGAVTCRVGAGAFAPCASSYPNATALTLHATANSGSTFTGWSNGAGNATVCNGTNVDCAITLTANSTLTATFVLPVSVSVTGTPATVNGGGGTVQCSAAGGAAVTCGSYPVGTIITMTATPNAASNFTGWSSGAGNATVVACNGTTAPCQFTLTAATSLTANFNRPTLTVVVAGTGTVSSSPAGINTCSTGCTAPFDKATPVTLTGGTGLTGWSGGGCSGSGTCVVTLNQNTTVTAMFGIILPPPSAKRLSASLGFTLAARADGSVLSIGAGMTGGSGTTLPGTAARVISGLNNISSVMAYGLSQPNFAIATDGSVLGWGFGILGASVTGAYGLTVDTPILLPALGHATALSGCSRSGLPIVYALHSDGTVTHTPAISQIDTNATRTSTTQTVSTLTSVISMSEGCFTQNLLPQSVVVAVKSDGTVWTLTPFGTVVAGPPPFITTTTFNVTVAQVTGLPAITQVSCSDAEAHGYCLARATNGSMWAWGDNANGQLGDGTLIGRTIPIQVPGLASIAQVIAGLSESYAIDTNGAVFSWGAAVNPGTSGTLGRTTNNTTTDRMTPGLVPLPGPATALAASGFHAVVLLNNGTVWSWGSNLQGELGDGTSGNISVLPVQAVGLNLN